MSAGANWSHHQRKPKLGPRLHSSRKKPRSLAARIAFWIDVLVVILLLWLLLGTGRAHAEQRSTVTVSSEQYHDDIKGINDHLTYDDNRINGLSSDLSFVKGIGWAVLGLVGSSFVLRARTHRT